MKKFTVSKKHIKTGIPGELCLCPVAQCVKEEFGIPLENDELDVDRVEVTTENIEVFQDGILTHVFLATKKLGKFIRDFDDKKKVKPVTFTLQGN